MGRPVGEAAAEQSAALPLPLKRGAVAGSQPCHALCTRACTRSAMQATETGRIVNHMSADVSQIQQFLYPFANQVRPRQGWWRRSWSRRACSALSWAHCVRALRGFELAAAVAVVHGCNQLPASRLAQLVTCPLMLTTSVILLWFQIRCAPPMLGLGPCVVASCLDAAPGPACWQGVAPHSN